MTDQEYMLGQSSLQKKGEGWTNPNPMVGAVIVKTAGSSGKVIIKNAENFMQSAMQSHRLQNRQRGCDNLCYAGTMLSLWQDAAVYGSNFRTED